MRIHKANSCHIKHLPLLPTHSGRARSRHTRQSTSPSSAGTHLHPPTHTYTHTHTHSHTHSDARSRVLVRKSGQRSPRQQVNSPLWTKKAGCHVEGVFPQLLRYTRYEDLSRRAGWEARVFRGVKSVTPWRCDVLCFPRTRRTAGVEGWDRDRECWIVPSGALLFVWLMT